MDNAHCSDDGQIYEAVDFSRLDSIELERKRRLLHCPECDGPAFFRNTSSIGRAPCFGARPHATGCSLAAYDLARIQSMVNEDALLNSVDKIVVDLRFGTSEQTGSDSWSEHASPPVSFRGGRPDMRRHRRPSSLLRLLINQPAFGQSDQPIEVLGLGDIPAREFFVPLDNATPRLQGLFRGFWGFLSDVKLKDKTVWFNCRGQCNFSFCLNSEFLSDFNQRYDVGSMEDLAGAYVLVLGTLRVSRQGKPFCVIDGPEFMALKGMAM
jgi:hypothetical protein